MSSLTYLNEEGAGQKHSDACYYSQAVLLPGGIVKASGQGGWDTTGKMDATDEVGQVKLAFENVERVLQAAGLRGWSDVYSVRSYDVDIGVTFPLMVEELKRRLPSHRPIWTSIGVPALAFPEMRIEIEVEAIKA
ncbi:Endoribonuclease L-PSP/chorismate mutase-like protein [Plectosphaerella plurivora]|uniref:Endoribonuclease L-PSP/chorismate mutase-like protein n=1 Tax=Plectosphaerella plurivora TaxID=936078 RepID=A0A9P9AAI6_9PEZI|nr:Endoribonuclease L-PSP/chorismate mutase-like protein [Plectosphaerella plurivora]